MVTQRYRVERAYVPTLPPRYEDPAAILPLLGEISEHAPGVVALEDGRVMGFIIGELLPIFRGKRTIYSPEWAHAAIGECRRAVYQAMVTQLACRGVANGCLVHVITLLAHDEEALDTWRWLGFAMTAVHRVRNLAPIEGPSVSVDIRRAGPDDLGPVLALSEALDRYMARAPIYMPFVHRRERSYYEGRLEDPAYAQWLAHREGTAVAWLGIGPTSTDAATIIRDEGTASITRAFTREQIRGQGIGTALLNRALDWAHSTVFARCAVDFEPENVLSVSFWLDHFQPVCYSLIRHIDERLTWAQAGRDLRDVW